MEVSELLEHDLGHGQVDDLAHDLRGDLDLRLRLDPPVAADGRDEVRLPDLRRRDAGQVPVLAGDGGDGAADERGVEDVLAELSTMPPLVTEWEVETLRSQLADAALGRADAVEAARKQAALAPRQVVWVIGSGEKLVEKERIGVSAAVNGWSARWAMRNPKSRSE